MTCYSMTCNKNALVVSNSGLTRAVALMWVTQVHASMSCHFLMVFTSFYFLPFLHCPVNKKAIMAKKNARKDISTEYENLIQKIFFTSPSSQTRCCVILLCWASAASYLITFKFTIWSIPILPPKAASLMFSLLVISAKKCYYMLVNCWEIRLTVLDLVSEHPMAAF